MRKFKRTLPLLLAGLILLLLCACSQKEDRVYPTSMDDLDGLRAGAGTGMIHDQLISAAFPHSEISFFTTYADLLVALNGNKIDYYTTDAVKAKLMSGAQDNTTILDGSLGDLDYGFIFRKDSPEADALRAEMDAFITKALQDGTLPTLEQKWIEDPVSAVEHAKMEDIPLSGENGTLKMAICSSSPPFSFISNNELTGFDIEFAKLFCREYGYQIEFCSFDFNGMLPAVSSGKCDFGGSSIAITEERAASVNFSTPYMRSYMAITVAKSTHSGLGLSSLADSFYKTFIKEERWKLVLDGLLVTLWITVGAGILGSLLGFCIYLLCRNGNKWLSALFSGLSWVLNSLPIVVVLMILYYILFAKSTMSGTLVAILAFALSLACKVYPMLQTAVKSVSRGQLEGAYSLGFTDRQAFFGIILPQAMTQFIPNYKTALVTMLKDTAIVGYIAVQDLTKVSDIIRSRTYEAFFPIIATAFIYVLLVLLITLLIKRISIHFTPQNRSEKMVLRVFQK